MRLTLTYQGPLPAKQRGVSPVKANLRRAFHPQIRAQVGRVLSDRTLPHVSTVIGGHSFVSPAHSSFRTAVDLDILLLVPHERQRPGDADNRLKTLVDGLTRPANSEQLQDFREPEEGGPTYCLMDDDGLARQLRIDIRPWYAPSADPQDALAVVTATIVLGENADLSSPTGNIFLVL